MGTDTLIVGFDGLDPDLLDRWRESLPNLTDVRNRGSSTRLASTVPTVTGVAWPALVTGKGPAKTGVTHFGDESGLVNRETVQSKALWELLDDAGLDVCVVGVPVSYPPDETDGIVVSGIMTPTEAEDWVTPRELADELPKPIFDPGHAPKEDLFEAIDSRDDLATSLLDRREWDAFVIVYMESDRGGHSLLTPRPDSTVSGWDDLREIYERLDSSLAMLTERGKPRNTVVVSDHGYGRVPRRRFNVNRWLEERGYVEFEHTGIVQRWASKERIERAIDELSLLPYLPERIRRYGRRVLPSESSAEVNAESSVDVTYTEQWLSGAFDVGDETTEEELADELASVTDPETGDAVFDAVYLSRERFDGPYLERLPSITAKFAPNYRAQSTFGDALVDQIPTNAVTTDHRFHGVLLAAGEDFEDSSLTWEDDGHITDVTPTLLHMLGVAVPEDCDGAIQTPLFRRDSDPARRSVREGSPSKIRRGGEGFTDEGVENRLEDLGYL